MATVPSKRPYWACGTADRNKKKVGVRHGQNSVRREASPLVAGPTASDFPLLDIPDGVSIRADHPGLAVINGRGANTNGPNRAQLGKCLEQC
jgi:hypothetical protein